MSELPPRPPSPPQSHSSSSSSSSSSYQHPFHHQQQQQQRPPRYNQHYNPNHHNNNQHQQGQNFRRRAREDFEGRDGKKRKYDDTDDAEVRLSLKIAQLGDKTTSSSIEASIENLALSLEDDIRTHRTQVINNIINCICGSPTKTAFYATLVGLLNLKHFELVKELVVRIYKELQNHINAGNYDAVRLTVRFIGELVNANVLMPASIISVFDVLLSVVHEEDIPSSRIDAFLFPVLCAMPWVARELSERKRDDLSRLLSVMETAIKKRTNKLTLIVSPLTDIDETLGDYLDDAWRQVTYLREADWQTSSIIHISSHFSNRLASGVTHNFPMISLPQHTNEKQYIISRPFLRIFEEGADKDISPIDRFILETYITDILTFRASNPKECIKALLEIPVPFSYFHLLVETILGCMFALPHSRSKTVFYGCIFIYFFRAVPTIIPPILAMAVDSLFDRLEHLDIGCYEIFIEWFSHHLSNFDFKWNWKEWEYVLSGKEDSAKALFLQDLFERLVRLSYNERIEKAVPKEFSSYFPPIAQPNFKFQSSDPNSEANQLLAKMKAKETKENIKAFLESDKCASLTAEENSEMFLQCVLFLGSKSFSHMLNVFERYIHLLRSMFSTQQLKVYVLKNIYDFWSSSPQKILIHVDRLLTFRVLDSTSTINWLFLPENLPLLKRGWAWELLRTLVNKALARTFQIRREIEKTLKIENSADKLSKLNAALEVTLREQKEVFLVMFQKIVASLDEYLKQNNENKNDFWFARVIGNLEDLGRKYHSEIKPFLETLGNVIFNSELDERITRVYNNWCLVY